jgi:uncharacterized membrane protein
MSKEFDQLPENAITQSRISRVIPCRELDVGDPIKWLSLGLQDARHAPFLTIFYGIIFAIIPWGISVLVALTGWHLVILPALVCFMMLGPFLAAGLYDISWELEKGHSPNIWHSLKALKRNAVNEWAFGLMLTLIMIFWLRVASLLHALYPSYLDPTLTNLLPFLLIGTAVGAVFTGIVFLLTAFTQPILMERQVDLATAVLTSINAVWLNKTPMFVWSAVIFTTVAIGFVTGFIGFIVLMPVIGYASWHAYIDCIETKRQRNYI